MRAADPACKAAVETARRIAPLARGEVAAVAVAERPEKPAGARLQGRRRRREIARRLARPHRAAEPVGHLVRALPQGDAGARRPAERKLGGADFEVVAVNIDTRDPDKPKAWLKEVGVNTSPITPTERQGVSGSQGVGKASACRPRCWSTPTAASFARLAGPAEWASDDAVKLVSAALKKISPAPAVEAVMPAVDRIALEPPSEPYT